MSLWMIGSGGWQPPFNRTFFNVAIGELLERVGKDKGSRLTLYLVDGTQLDVRGIDNLSDQFVIVSACPHNGDDTEKHYHVLPYSSIYRIEVSRSPDADSRRLGFRWTSLSDENRTSRKAPLKGALSPASSERETNAP